MLDLLHFGQGIQTVSIKLLKLFYFIYFYFTYISLLIIPCMIVYVTNKQEP